MTFDLKRMLESKKALRRKLAGRPLPEKLAILDELRDRAWTIRNAGLDRSGVRESSGKYRSENGNKKRQRNTT